MAFDANDLSPHEHFVMERTRGGEVADFTPMVGADGAKPGVRAGFLRKLLLGVDPSWIVRGAGVRIKGARIEGALDLTDCSGSALPALALEDCEAPEPIDASHAHLARLTLRQCKLKRLSAKSARIDGELALEHCAAIGPAGAETLCIDISGAQIGGDLRLSATALARAGDGEAALLAAGVSVGGDVLLNAGFEALGAIALSGARVGGDLQVEGQLLGRSDDAKGVALNASGADIGGAVSIRAKAEGVVEFSGARIGGDANLSQSVLRNENGAALLLANTRIGGQLLGAFKLAGHFSLQGAEIARNLDLRGAEIANPLTRDSYGRALDATSVNVGGGALLQGANIKGETLFADARIAGYFSFGGGRFINAGGWAIRAPNARVGGNLTFTLPENGFTPHGQKTVIEGGAKFARAQIGGKVAWDSLELRGAGPDGAKGAVFSLADAVIGAAVEAHGLIAQQSAFVDLSGARCSALDDNMKSGWGVETSDLGLDGFEYERIDSADERWRTRLAWLKRNANFTPQPFVQAARVYARMGRRDDARRIQLAQHDLQTRAGAGGPLTWLLSSLFGLVAGYGLAPLRVVRALTLFLALGVVGVFAMNAEGALVTPRGAACNGAVEPALYAIDVAVPLLDLGQESRCAPGRTTRAELSPGMEVSPLSDWRLFEGVALWRWAHALYAILGAILTALAILTFSGVMKPKTD